jgi:NAD(P)-dependent dehydrogenase (short-subunit alcohol dehydrogenase family)
MDSASLEGKVALITGAGGGIGSATARVMAERGARLVLADIHLPGAECAAAAAIAAGASAVAVHLDLNDPASIQAMIDYAIATYGRLDILHNNAADQDPQLTMRDGNIADMDIEVWDRVFRVNVRGTMLCCKAAIPHMLAQGGGAIVNTASNLGLQGQVIQAAYAASKAAILQMTRSIAASHGRHGIRCNAVLPGLVLTPAARNNLPPALLEAVESETLTPYLGEPDDIAYAVAYVASDQARYMTGQNIVVDGGTSTHVPGFARFNALFGAAQ